jgi:ABC-2 type transport system permease protein
MRRTLVICRREVESYFVSPVFWVLAWAFLAFFGLAFGIYVGQTGGQAPQAEMGPLMGLLGTILLFVTPILAMRLLSEEMRSGTMELLMTSPVREWHVVLGKWLAAFFVFAIMIALTGFHVAIMMRLATNGMAPGPLFASYVGTVLLGAALLAVGTLTSSLTENQVVAAFLGIMAVMVLWFLPLMGSVMGTESLAATVLSYAGLSDHYFNFGEGVIDTRDALYFLLLTVGALYVATRFLESRRWR